MSTPTKIYLVLVTMLLAVWAALSAFQVIGRPGTVFSMDPEYRMRHAGDLTAVLRGRVDLVDANGDPMEPPVGALIVDVRATSADGVHNIRRIAEVRADGVFEVSSLPHGNALVAVQLGGGEVVWQAEGIVVGTDGVLDPRLDPIDLSARLFEFSLVVRDPAGEPANEGRIAWRSSDGMGDDQTFSGVAPVHTGVARFLTTSSMVDAVSLVPGARAELFEGLYPRDVIDLGPGTTVIVEPTGALPDPERWQVRALLEPVEPLPRIDIASHGFAVGDASLYAALNEEGRAEIPVPRVGAYRLRWWVRSQREHRFASRKFNGPDELIDVPVGAERHVVRADFPIDEFVRRTPARGFFTTYLLIWSTKQWFALHF